MSHVPSTANAGPYTFKVAYILEGTEAIFLSKGKTEKLAKKELKDLSQKHFPVRPQAANTFCNSHQSGEFMSHVSTVNIEINDLQALRDACKELGLEFVENQKTYKWYGRWVNDYNQADSAYNNGIKPEDYGKCEHAIRIPGNANAYEVGVAKKADGKLTLVWDLWQGGKGLEARIGTEGAKLRQEYSLAVAMKDMQKRGFRTQRQVNTTTGKPQMRAWRQA